MLTAERLVGAEAVLDEVSQTIFSDKLSSFALRDSFNWRLLLHPPTEYEKFPFSTLDRNIVEGTTTLRGKIVQKYLAMGPMLKRWTVVLEGKDDVELLCSWGGQAPRGWDRWQVGATVGFVGEVQLDDGLEMQTQNRLV